MLLALSLGSLALLLATHAAAHFVLSRKTARTAISPAISILKPLKGVDDGLQENLESFARLEYPDYELLIGVAQADDPAVPHVRRLQRAHPDRAIRLLICDAPLGRNPKVAILASLSRAARHDLVLISDSNVRVRPDYLQAMAAELADSRVGLVSSVIAGTGEKTAGALLENLHLASFVAASVCAADLVGHACVVGKSMLFRLSDLARLGGFRAVRHVLAEDYVLGQRFQKAGYRVALSPHAIETVNQRWPVSRFVERHLRWSQMRRRLNLAAYLGEPLLNPSPLLVAVLALAVWQRAPAEVALASGGLVLKCAADALLLARLRGVGVAAADLPMALVKDALVLGIWAIGMFRQTVCWRGNRLRVVSGSVLLPARAVGEGIAKEAA